MSQELEELDRLQRENENTQQPVVNNVFANSIEEALDTDKDKIATPLVTQEEIENEEPPRINLTAVVCTAIVAVCATIILLVAHPWKNDDPSPAVASLTTDSATLADNGKASAPKADTKANSVKNDKPAANNNTAQNDGTDKNTNTAKNDSPAKADEPKAESVNPQVSSLPVVKTTKTGTGNPYNGIRLIDASSRKLTKSETEQMTKDELALARNAIYARHGYQFNNPDLKEFFAKQSWFKPSDVKIDAIPFTQIELDNIRLIKAQESK